MSTDNTKRDIEKIWREKSDEDLLDAAASLEDYTDEGRQVIRGELKRRGLEDPVEQAGDYGATGKAGGAEASDAEGAAVDVPQCLRCQVELRFVGVSRFHEGTRWGVLGEIGHLFEQSEAFDVYVCPQCGHVDLFVSTPISEDEVEDK